MIYSALRSGHVPSSWKNAFITPLLKKPGLELVYNNYRPVSNLSFISKLTVFKQLHAYFASNNLYPWNQSAYRPNKQRVTLLVLLDLSAAFNTVDHQILLNRLHSDFGITGTALEWFSSYLKDRKQRALIDGVSSQAADLSYGVPQGSCLGPLLFTLYI